ncbi:unnamed protein product [Scytosiphon promiscuus]
MFTDYTNEEGEWRTEKDSGDPITLTVWTSGMVAGMFWYQYEATGAIEWKEYAEDIQIGLEGVELLDDNDLGFQTLNSFGLGYRLVGTDAFKNRVLDGADSLFGFRYVSNIPAFWSWENPTQEPQWERAVNVDMIMNMEIMLWASVNGGNAAYPDYVEGHADTTWEHIVRTDYSTFHVADFDPDTGDLVDKGKPRTYQGWTDDSTWSRGQAWAIHGFAMVYRYLKEPRFLERSILLLGYFDGNLPDDNVPYADFDAPIDESNPKDSSSTAIVASSLFEIFELSGNPIYLEKAQTYLSSLLLSSTYFNSAATDGWEALLRESSAAWDEPATGSVTGDYFLLETMASAASAGAVRYKTMAPSILLRNETEVLITSSSLTAQFSGASLDGDVDLSGLVEASPVVLWLGVTLTNTGNVPESMTVASGSLSVSVDVVEPEGGWSAGENNVTFSVASGTFSGLGAVDAVSLTFGAVSTETTGATVDYFVVGHKLKTFFSTCSAEGELCDAAADCCTGTCNGGTCASSTVFVASPLSPIDETASTCINGFEGIDGSGIVCCSAGCTQCGGVGCSSSGLAAGLGSDSCCESGIIARDEYCEDTQQAPCIIGSRPSTS